LLEEAARKIVEDRKGFEGPGENKRKKRKFLF
jgi:hypothetical protein